MKNNDLVILICFEEHMSSENVKKVIDKFIELYQTDKVKVIHGMGFNQIAITNTITCETSLLNNKHD